MGEFSRLVRMDRHHCGKQPDADHGYIHGGLAGVVGDKQD